MAVYTEVTDEALRAFLADYELGGLVATNSLTVGQTVLSLQQTAQTLNRTALTQQGLMENLIQNLRSASDGLDRLVQDLGETPAVLLFGQPPEPLPENRKEGITR